MSPRKQNMLLVLRLVIDLVAVCFAWVFAYDVRFHRGLFPLDKGTPDVELYFKLLPFLVVIWLCSGLFTGFYRRSTRHRSAFLEGIDILQAATLSALAFIVFTYFYEEYRYSRLVLVLFVAFQIFLLISGRSLVRKGLRWYRRHNPARKVLLIGGGAVFRDAVHMLPRMDLVSTEVLGAILLEGPSDENSETAALCQLHGIPVFPLPQDWSEFLFRNPVHTAIIAVPQNAASSADAFLPILTDQVNDVRIVPDIGRYTRFGSSVSVIQGVVVININDSPLSGLGAVAKRASDLVLGMTAVIVTSPIQLAAAILIKVTSRGPVFYRQERMGMDGRTFSIIKFRTMPVDAERASGPVWASSTDPRPTWVGKWLRRLSIDEFPQFFQVVTGKLSVVGPRPERPFFVDQFRRQVPGYMLRHKVRAGLTGWAQINGFRGNTSIEKRIEYDLYYIRHWSLWLDLKIVARTVKMLFFDANAY